MPIEELLALYNCDSVPIQPFTSNSGSRRRSRTSRNAGNDKTLMPPPDTPKTTAETPPREQTINEPSEYVAAAKTATETEMKPITDATIKEENETKDEATTEPNQNEKHEENEICKATNSEQTEQPATKCETTTETTEAHSHKGNESQDDNQSTSENTNDSQANGPYTEASVDEIEHSTKGNV